MRRQNLVMADKYDVVWALATFPADLVPLALDRLHQLHAAGIQGGSARLATLSLMPVPVSAVSEERTVEEAGIAP